MNNKKWFSFTGFDKQAYGYGYGAEEEAKKFTDLINRKEPETSQYMNHV
jgi:hypothetical protein